MTNPQQLHDRATRGLPLSEEERAQLNAWYAQEDEMEARLLVVSVGSESTEVLHMQIRAALAQVAIVTHGSVKKGGDKQIEVNCVYDKYTEYCNRASG